MHPVRALIPALLLTCSGALAQPVPLGPPFLVNTTTQGVQAGSAVAADAEGRFAVVWISTCAQDPEQIFPPCSPDPRTAGLFGRWFDAAGRPAGPEIRLSLVRTAAPDLAVGADGSFFVVWGYEDGILGRRFDASGTPLGRAVRISPLKGDILPAVAAVPGGGYVVSWLRRGTYSIVMARRLDAAGRPAGSEIRVSTEDHPVPRRPAVGVDASGGFLVAWVEFPLGSDPVPEHPLLARRFKASGAPLGREIRLDGNETSGVQVDSPAVEPLAGGGFLVAWTENGGQVYARALMADGSPGEKRRIDLGQSAGGVAIARDSRGGFLAVWNRPPVAGTPSYGVVGRRLDEAGRPTGQELTVVDEPRGFITNPGVAATPDGFVVTWDSGGSFDGPGPDGNASGVFARLYGIPPAGADLCLFDAMGFHCDLFRDGGEDVSFVLGGPLDTPLFGDVDGDGRDDPCIFRAGQFLCDTDHTGGAEVDLAFQAFQPDSGLPLLGDINGDDRDDPCVYAGHQFLCDTAHDGGTAELVVAFGRQTGDAPLLGDLDGDADDDPCVYRGRQLLCDLAHDGDGSDLVLTFGETGDRALLADIDGDGRDDLCVVRGNLLLCDTAHNGGAAEIQIPFNPAGGTLVVGNVDGY